MGDTVPSSYRELSGAHLTGLIIDGVVDILWHGEEWAVSISLVCPYLFISGLLSLLVSFSFSHLSFSPLLPSLPRPVPFASSADFGRVNVPAALQPQHGQ